MIIKDSFDCSDLKVVIVKIKSCDLAEREANKKQSTDLGLQVNKAGFIQWEQVCGIPRR